MNFYISASTSPSVLRHTFVQLRYVAVRIDLIDLISTVATPALKLLRGSKSRDQAACYALVLCAALREMSARPPACPVRDLELKTKGLQSGSKK